MILAVRTRTNCCWTIFLIFLPASVFTRFRFRLLCQSIIAHKLFDYVVLVFIFLNCITVALERPKILQGSLVRAVSVRVTLVQHMTPSTAQKCFSSYQPTEISFCSVLVCYS